MIGQQGPSIDGGLRLCGEITQPGDKVLPVLVVIYDPALFSPSDDNVMESSRSIESRLAGHRTYLGISDSGIIALMPEFFYPVINVPLVPLLSPADHQLSSTLSPTYPRSESTFNLDDYGRKGSITPC